MRAPRWLVYVWDPTKAPPETRTEVNLRLYRVTWLATPLLLALGFHEVAGMVGLIALSLKTDLATAFTNVQVGDVREQEGDGSATPDA